MDTILYGMALNPQHLAAFRMVARHGGFTAASDAAMITQPALSKQVASLERHLGRSLLVRSRRGVELTPAGTELLAYADRIAHLMDEAERCVQDGSGMVRGRLRVGATPTVGTYFMPKTLVYFRQRFAGIELHAEVNSIGVLAARLADGLLDVMLTTSDASVPGGQDTMLFRTALLAVCAPTLQLARDTTLKMRDLASTPLIVRDLRDGVPDETHRLLSVHRMSTARSLTFSTTESMKCAAVAGLGVAFVPKLSVERELGDRTLIALPVTDLKAHQDVRWIEHASRPRSKPVHAYCCILKHTHRGTLPKPRLG